MTTLQSEISLTPVETRTAVSSESTDYSLLVSQAPKRNEKWSAIFKTLHEWWENPSLLDYDEIEPPSVEMIKNVLETGKEMRRLGLEDPDRVIPDGESGIVLKWKNNTNLTVLNFEADGCIERIEFQNNKIVERRILQK